LNSLRYDRITLRLTERAKQWNFRLETRLISSHNYCCGRPRVQSLNLVDCVRALVMYLPFRDTSASASTGEDIVLSKSGVVSTRTSPLTDQYNMVFDCEYVFVFDTHTK